MLHQIPIQGHRPISGGKEFTLKALGHLRVLSGGEQQALNLAKNTPTYFRVFKRSISLNTCPLIKVIQSHSSCVSRWI
jgi:hypothetical protein